MALLPTEIKLILALERRFPLPSRERFLLWLERGLFLAVAASFLLRYLGFETWAPKMLGLVLLGLSAWLSVSASVYFSRFHLARGYAETHPLLPATRWLVAEAVAADDQSLLLGWLKSPIGRRVHERLGFKPESVLAEVLTGGAMPAKPVSIQLSQFKQLGDLAGWLLGAFPNYGDWLSRKGVAPDQLIKAANWVAGYQAEQFLQSAWWRWEYLAQIPGLGKNWHYGAIPTLDNYGQILTVPTDAGQRSPFLNQVKNLESVLNRSREANAVLVGDLDSLLGVIKVLAGRIGAGVTWPQLEGRQIFLLETGRLLADQSQPLPERLLTLAAEAAHAGNIILVIDDLPRLSVAVSAAGVPFATLLDAYLAGRALTVIGLADDASYHAALEPDAVLLNRFETIKIESPAETGLWPVLTDFVLTVEAKTGFWFTYQAVEAIVDNAGQFFGGGTLLAESLDLLDELMGYLAKQRLRVVTKEAVLDFLRVKTNIPLGTIRTAERDQLLNLETTLSGRVIGQATAIKSVAGALRRARAGTRNPGRPIGTFLFLGPTGVGKTETAKALSAALFGREDALLRLDMSEYSGEDALERLIGSFESGQAGTLSTLAREHPYGVLLLDEFEKTAPAVQNLFLQILDEGVFADMRGRRVSLRSLAIIATSNAGADLIWELVGQNQDLAGQEKALIDHLVKQGIFKPELLNRFDATVLFKPLGDQELKRIATLMLEKLASRLKLKQGIKLEITPVLVEQVAKRGANRQFGARPMQRFIQETVEQLVADGLIAGRIKTGSQVSFVPLKLATGDNPLGLELWIE